LLVDFDQDGDLDLIFSTQAGIKLWSNRGDATFYDITDRSTLPPAIQRPTALVAVDFDRDLDLDVLAVGSNQPAGYLENLRHGTSRWHPLGKCFNKLDKNVSALAVVDLIGAASWGLVGGGPKGLEYVPTDTLEP